MDSATIINIKAQYLVYVNFLPTRLIINITKFNSKPMNSEKIIVIFSIFKIYYVY